MNYSKTASKIRRKLNDFSGKLSAGLTKPTSRMVTEIIYGVTTKQSLLLSEVVRSLDESIPEIKTENRLSTRLKNKDISAHIRAGILRAGAECVGQDTLLILDLSDIAKKHARAMEYLAHVRDGSEKRITSGYWTVNVIGAELSGRRITPLYGDLYSQKNPEFISENHEIMTAVATVSEAVGRRGIWVMDRGGDRQTLFDPLLDDGLRFLVRLRGDRNLTLGKNTRSARDLARTCPMLFTENVIRERGGKPVTLKVEFGARRVRLPWRGEELWMVVVKGFGAEPLMLLTNVSLTKSRKALWRIVESYITRWEIEETIRYVKQSYGVENVRVRGYVALRNMFSLLIGAVYFATIWLGKFARLEILSGHVITAAKRFFGTPEFVYYAIADGVGEILRRHGKYGGNVKSALETSAQLALL